jgi:protein-disulfide isomerase
LTTTVVTTLLFALVACARPPGVGGEAGEASSGSDRAASGAESNDPPPVAWPTGTDLAGADAVRAQIPLDGRPAIGAAEPLVTLVVFTDFECPHCARLRVTLARLTELYGDETRVVFRQFPLPSHPHARDAAVAALAVHRALGDEAFERMHDLMFDNQRALERADLATYAGEAGLPPGQLEEGLASDTFDALVAEDVALGRRVRISGTPTLFVNGRMVAGSPTFLELEAIVDEEVVLAREAMRRGVLRAELYDAVLAAASPPEAFVRRRVAQPSRVEDAPPPDDDRVFVLAVPEGAPARGPADARVTIQVWSDFECGHCASLVPTLERLREAYPDTLRVVFRHYPLSFHRHARDAHLAAIAVLAQRGPDAFWRFHDELFAHQDALGEEELEQYAEAAGLAPRPYRRAVAEPATNDVLERDVGALEELGVSIGTPMVFVNGRLMRGARPYEELRAAVDRALAEGG